jgi:formylglycine-generating enzyme required for sulfatase activity
VQAKTALPGVEVDCSTWESDIPEEQWSTGRCEVLTRSLPAVEADCSGWGAAPVRARKLVLGGLVREFAWLPPGTFWMGGGGVEPGYTHVMIDEGFGLGIYPVTQEQWEAVMGNNPSHFSRTGGGNGKVKEITDADLVRFPVESVSWEDVQQFLAKLNEQQRGGEWLYRLPTKAEWEYACRGGASSQEECAFDFYLDRPTNDLSSTQANFDGNHPDGGGPQGQYLKRTTKVGSYKPNRLGLYDMHGNVWEWCLDLSDGGPSRVLRGGCWRSFGRHCRAAFRSGRAPTARDHDVGFRLARTWLAGTEG